MDIELLSHPLGQKQKIWMNFLAAEGLETDDNIEQTVLIWDNAKLIAAGSRQENLLKCIAVDRNHRGEDLTATLLTALRREAFQEGYDHLFLYTKPTNKYLFSSLFFYPVAQTDKVLLMEDRKDGIHSFLESLMDSCSGDVPASKDSSAENTSEMIGAAIMNCNPFTLGHRYLIENAAKECRQLYVFVLSEDKSRFSAADRLEMVRLGTEDLPNVTVLPTGPYLISSATFPTYFLKEREQAEEIHCLLDIEIFVKYFVPRFAITHRYVGTEPLSPMTKQYNEALKTHLPQKGIALRELPRFETLGIPVSASAVRARIDEGSPEKARQLLPQTTFDYLQAKNLL